MNGEYMSLETAKRVRRYNILLKRIRLLKKENEKLKNELKEIKEKYVYTPKTSFKEIIKLRDENKRLNNIINELEKNIIENSFGSPANNCSVIETYKILDKLQELKGSDKE